LLGAAQALECVRGPSPGTPALHLAKTPMDEPREDAPETRETASVPAAPPTTTIEIADADSEAAGDGGPYKNLWVPLVVVPAGIVFAIVAVFALFGSLGGSEKTLAENLALVVSGGKNERQQALFGLTRQVTENRAALAEGREAPWEVPVGFARDVQAAYEGLDPDEYDKMLVFGILLSSMGEARGVEVLLELLELTDDQDPEGRVRFGAVQNLGLLADMGRAEALAASAPVRALAGHEDPGLRVVAAGALGSLPGDGVQEALQGLLGDQELQVRATAGLSLSRLDPPDPAAIPLLTDMAGAEIWESAREESPGQFRRASDVQRFRVMAVEALGRYGEVTRAALEAHKESEDLRVREAALRMLKALGQK
jgi:HEAT repeat protein